MGIPSLITSLETKLQNTLSFDLIFINVEVDQFLLESDGGGVLEVMGVCFFCRMGLIHGTSLYNIPWEQVGTRAGRVRELTRSSRSKFKMVWHQFSSVQFPSHQFVRKVRSVQFLGSPI